MDAYKCGISSNWFDKAKAEKTKPRNRLEDLASETKAPRKRPDHNYSENSEIESTFELVKEALSKQGSTDITTWNILQTRAPEKKIDFRLGANNQDDLKLYIKHSGKQYPLTTGLLFYTARELKKISFEDFKVEEIQKDLSCNIKLLEAKFVLEANLREVMKKYPDALLIELLEHEISDREIESIFRSYFILASYFFGNL